jgi:hypothetical protein
MLCVHSRSARGIPITLISWAPMLCALSSPPSSSLTFRRSHVKTHYHHLRLLHTCIWGALAGGRWAALLLRFCGTEYTEEGKSYSPKGASLPPRAPLLSSPTCKLRPPNISYLFPTRPANPNILSSPSHTALCGHDFFGFIPTVWRVPSVVEGLV